MGTGRGLRRAPRAFLFPRSGTKRNRERRKRSFECREARKRGATRRLGSPGARRSLCGLGAGGQPARTGPRSPSGRKLPARASTSTLGGQREAEPHGTQALGAGLRQPLSPGRERPRRQRPRAGVGGSPAELGREDGAGRAAAHGWDGASSKLIRLLSWLAAFPAVADSVGGGPSLFTTTSSSSSSMLGHAVWSSTRFSRSFSAFRASCLQGKIGWTAG